MRIEASDSLFANNTLFFFFGDASKEIRVNRMEIHVVRDFIKVNNDQHGDK